MSRRTISLKSIVRYEGRSHTTDRRSDLAVLPNPIWYTVGQVLRSKFRKRVPGDQAPKPPA